MSKLSFSTSPQKKYYSYKDDGCIFSINCTEPTKMAEGGGVWYCYFKCMPYAKTDDGDLFLIYKQTNTDATLYTALSSSSYYNGDDSKYYYYDSTNSKYVAYSISDGYYDENGKTNYTWPNSSKELPRVVYEYGDGTSATYYFDTLIGTGDTYLNSTFTPLNIDDGNSTTKTTYGSLLLTKVKDSIRINSFVSDVEKLPEYLTGSDISKGYSITDIGYYIVGNYLAVYGLLFVEKLNAYMKSYGDAIIDKYDSDDETRPYAKAKISVTNRISDIGRVEGTVATTAEPRNEMVVG